MSAGPPSTGPAATPERASPAMRRINQDTIVALFLLVLAAAFYAASFDIKEMGYASLGSEVWPRLILAALVAATLVYLARSLREARAPAEEAAHAGRAGRYRNPFVIFALFAAFLLTLPWLGMLIGGVLFVFVTLGFLGGWGPRALAVHGAIALVSVGAMWTVFTFGLRVILPAGEILPI